MIRWNIGPQEIVAFLNSLMEVDRRAINALFDIRVSCNEDMRDHETVQVMCNGEWCQVGIIGILNGLFGTYDNGYGCIAADMDDGEIVGFRLLDAAIARNGSAETSAAED